MFGWIKRNNKLPLEGSRRAEIELRMRQIVEHQSIDWLKRIDVVTDISQLCPSPISSVEQANAITTHIAEKMAIDASDVMLEVSDLEHAGAAGHYDLESKRIVISESLLGDPTLSVVTIAHHLSRHAVMRDLLNGPFANDDRWLTELFYMCSGFGILAANVTVRDVKSSSGQILDAHTLGYFAASDLGYASALFARLRDESDPHWSSLLRTDAGVSFGKAMRAFPGIERMLVDMDSVPGSSSSVAELETFLESDQESFRYAALRELAMRDESTPELVPAISRLLRGRDEAIVASAAYVLGLMGSAAIDALPMLESLVCNAADPVACAAAEAMLQIAPGEETYSIAGEMVEQRWSTSTRLASTIAAHGHTAAAVAPHICRRLVVALRQATDADVNALAACLHSIHPQPMEVLETVITNQETLDWVNEYLAALDSESE